MLLTCIIELCTCWASFFDRKGNFQINFYRFYSCILVMLNLTVGLERKWVYYSRLAFVSCARIEMVLVVDSKSHQATQQQKYKQTVLENMSVAEHSLMYFTWHLGSVKAWQRISQQAVELEIQYRWERHWVCEHTDTGMLVKKCFYYSSVHLFACPSFMLLLSESSCKQSIAHTRAHTYTLLLRPGNHKLCLSPYQTSH